MKIEPQTLLATAQRTWTSLREAVRPDSLAFRLFTAAAVWSLIALPLTGLVLHSLFREQVEYEFDQRLKVFVTTLIAESYNISSTVPHKPEDMVEPLFKQPLTGWYWQIKPIGDHNGPTIISESLLSEKLAVPREKGVRADKDGHIWGNVTGPERKLLRVVEREVTIGHGEDAKGYSFAAAGPREEIDTTVAQFRNLMIVALSILGAGLLIATFFQVQYGLRPLKRIERGLAAIREGEAQRLEGQLPVEIQQLQYELNALIEANQDIVERARTQVGNLAHALKTPLSVITNEARDESKGKRAGTVGAVKGGTAQGLIADEAFAKKVSEQAEVMREQINHYLDRARMAARIGMTSGVTEIEPVARSLSRALTRIYDNKREDEGVKIDVTCPEGARFQGEKQDLEEMLGNLMDNACKWARSEVRLSIEVASTTAAPGHKRVHITVDDDGPGLSEGQRAEVGKRGKRLDETKPGSGLGLSIVADLAGLYRGRLELDEAPQGGLRARLELPAV
jgi:signal transduction histidine kinase